MSIASISSSLDKIAGDQKRQIGCLHRQRKFFIAIIGALSRQLSGARKQITTLADQNRILTKQAEVARKEAEAQLRIAEQQKELQADLKYLYEQQAWGEEISVLLTVSTVAISIFSLPIGVGAFILGRGSVLWANKEKYLNYDYFMDIFKKQKRVKEQSSEYPAILATAWWNQQETSKISLIYKRRPFIVPKNPYE
jgi:hypothetical protein